MDISHSQLFIDTALSLGFDTQQSINLCGLAVLSRFDHEDLSIIREQMRLIDGPDLHLLLHHRVLSGAFVSERFTVAEVSTALGMDSRSVRRACETGRLAARKSGATWLIAWGDLITALEFGKLRPRAFGLADNA